MDAERSLTLTLLPWIVILVAAQVCGRLAVRLGQPRVVGEIVAGILLGPSVFGACWHAGFHRLFSPEAQPFLLLLARIGLILFLFQVGLEFDYSHLRTRSRTVAAVAILGIAAPCLCGLLLGPWLHQEFAPQTPRVAFLFFVCVALSISALPVMGRILLEMGWERTALGTMAISAAAVDDAVGWMLLAVATGMAGSAFSGWRLLAQTAGVILFSVALLAFGKPLARRFWRDERGLTPEKMALLLMLLFACSLLEPVMHF